MPSLTTRLHPVGTTLVGLILVSVLVLIIRSPADAPQTMDAAEPSAEGQLMEATAGPDADSASQPPIGAAASAETTEPPLSDGCFRRGSSRAEVRAVMGEPDTVDFGAWIYGQSYVTFGYGVVLDYRNEGDLRMCS